MQESRAFLRPRAGLFADEKDLEVLAAEIDARWNWEVSRATGTSLEDEPPPIVGSRFEKLFSGKASDKRIDRFKDGYYERPDGHALVVLARSPAPLGDLDRVRVAVDRMHAVVRDVRASDPAWAAVRVTWTGDMIAGIDEYGAVRDDLLGVGAIGIALVLARRPPLLRAPARALRARRDHRVGLSVTFGAHEIVIGHLNVATGFLFSIIAGNGINVGHPLSRRVTTKSDAAARRPTRDSHRAQNDVAVDRHRRVRIGRRVLRRFAATKFPTFRQFAFIGASGMITCWIVDDDAWYRRCSRSPIAPMTRGAPWRSVRQSVRALVPRAPHALVTAASPSRSTGAVSDVRYVARDPMEYDLAKIQNDASPGSRELTRAWDVATSILGEFKTRWSSSPTRPRRPKSSFTSSLRARKNRSKPCTRSSISSPTHQAEKIPTLLAIAARVRVARENQHDRDADWSHIAPLLPPDRFRSRSASRTCPRASRGPFSGEERNARHDRPHRARARTRTRTTSTTSSATSSSFRETRLSRRHRPPRRRSRLVFADILEAVVHADSGASRCRSRSR